MKQIVLGGLGLLILIQVIRPARTNPPVDPSRSLESHISVPNDVQSVLKRSCYDCHSSSTVWPWYSNVAPVSWYVIRDVNVARRHVNFQDWSAQINPQEGLEHLGIACKLVREGRMPPADYRTIHKGTDVTPEETQAFCAWTKRIGAPEPSEKDQDKGD